MYRHATPGSTISVKILPGKRPELFSIKSLPQQLVSALTISGLSISVGWIGENEPKKKKAVLWDLLIFLVLYLLFVVFHHFALACICDLPFGTQKKYSKF